MKKSLAEKNAQLEQLESKLKKLDALKEKHEGSLLAVHQLLKNVRLKEVDMGDETIID
jgi:hypothetical protein